MTSRRKDAETAKIAKSKEISLQCEPQAFEQKENKHRTDQMVNIPKNYCISNAFVIHIFRNFA